MIDFEKLINHTRRRFHGAKGSHDWEHTERVMALGEHLARAEGADPEVVRCAAILHDIARAEEDQNSGKTDHAERGSEMATDALRKMDLPEDFVLRVAHCIRTHRFRGQAKPETLEAKVLFDADKLDSIGAVGIGRAFLFAGEIGAKLHNPGVDLEKTKPYTEEDTAYREYQVKLKKVIERILTAEGRRLAQERHKFMEIFFERLNREVAGIL